MGACGICIHNGFNPLENETKSFDEFKKKWLENGLSRTCRFVNENKTLNGVGGCNSFDFNKDLPEFNEIEQDDDESWADMDESWRDM